MRAFRFAMILCLFAAHTALAQERNFGAWSVGATNGKNALYAATTNDSKGLLGQYCFVADKNCVWLLANDIDCDTDGAYVILMNSDLAASTLEILCVKESGKSRFAFKDFDAIDAAIRKSSWIGFAFPMRNGNFKVSRFNLNGAQAAVQFMRDTATRLPAADKRNSTRDLVL